MGVNIKKEVDRIIFLIGNLWWHILALLSSFEPSGRIKVDSAQGDETVDPPALAGVAKW